jgi:signal transduction histidine kinase
MPAAVFLIGTLAIILLLWVDRINKHLINEADLVDALMDVQIHTATYHLWLEEALTGNVPVTMKDAMPQVDQAIHLVDVILNGGQAERDWIPEPLKDAELRARAENIRSLLITLRRLGLKRHQSTDRSGSGSDLEQQFHAVFKEILGKARQMEDNMEKDEAENEDKYVRLFLGIVIIWASVVVVATAGLWNRERRKKRAEEELLKANEQLFSQTEELREHREHLAELVNDRTAELATANEMLRSEISEREQTEVALKESEGQLRLLSSRLMTAQETERRTISRELHDELGHALTIVKLRLKSIERGVQGHAEIKEDCEDIMAYIDQTIENVRRLSRDLSPSILEDLGLTAALRWLADNFNRTFDGIISSAIDDIDHLFAEDDQIMIYRVLQEVLTNIGKHAQAANVSVVIRKIGGQVSFIIEDDGRGFSPPPSSMRDRAGKGLGLAIMEERVSMLGGVLEIQSKEGRGTRTSFSIPARKE